MLTGKPPLFYFPFTHPSSELPLLGNLSGPLHGRLPLYPPRGPPPRVLRLLEEALDEGQVAVLLDQLVWEIPPYCKSLFFQNEKDLS